MSSRHAEYEACLWTYGGVEYVQIFTKRKGIVMSELVLILLATFIYYLCIRINANIVRLAVSAQTRDESKTELRIYVFSGPIFTTAFAICFIGMGTYFLLFDPT